jgi:hypothetical protein
MFFSSKVRLVDSSGFENDRFIYYKASQLVFLVSLFVHLSENVIFYDRFWIYLICGFFS